MNFKTLSLKVDGESGKIAGYFSTYEKTPDSYGDIITPGAFTETLAKRKETGHPFPLCFNHDFSAVIGVVDSITEEEKGPYMEGHFLDTQQAQDVRKMVQSGAVYQFSFAYDTLESRKPTEDEAKSGVTNVLTKLDLFEVSVVTVPANQNAVITDIKSAIETEIKAGRRNRKSDEDIINQIIDLAKSLLTEEEDKPAEEVEQESVEELEAKSNEASEETKQDENLKRAASNLLGVINLMKGNSEDES